MIPQAMQQGAYSATMVPQAAQQGAYSVPVIPQAMQQAAYSATVVPQAMQQGANPYFEVPYAVVGGAPVEGAPVTSAQGTCGFNQPNCLRAGGPNAPAGNFGLPSNSPAPAIKPQGKQTRTKAIKARTAPSCVQALPAASKSLSTPDSPAGFAWLEDKPPHVQAGLLCPPEMSRWQ